MSWHLPGYINQSDHFNWWSDLSQQIMMTIQHADSFILQARGIQSEMSESGSMFFSTFFNSMISLKRSQLLEIRKRPKDIPRRNSSWSYQYYGYTDVKDLFFLVKWAVFVTCTTNISFCQYSEINMTIIGFKALQSSLNIIHIWYPMFVCFISCGALVL